MPPYDWQPFLDEITRLFGLIRDHWSFTAAVRMNRRSIRKMATVARLDSYRDATGNRRDGYIVTEKKGPYIQTGFVQRGIGFGWRLNDMGADLNELRPFFELMPVSLGVAVLTADAATILARNKAREQNPATAHENRSYQVALQEKPRAIALEVLKARGVPIVTIDTGKSIDGARAELVAFASARVANAPALGHSGQVEVLRAPPWWG